MSRTLSRQIFHIFIACFNQVTVGFYLCFPLYSINLKKHFDLTQTQVSLIGGMIILTSVSCYFGGLFFEKVGSVRAYIVWTLLGGGSSLLIYSSSNHTEFYHNNFWLLCLYFLILGFTIASMYISNIVINLKKVHSKRSGLIIGITMACNYMYLPILSLICKSFNNMCEIQNIFKGTTFLFFISNIFVVFLEKYDNFEINPDECVPLQINGDQLPINDEQVPTENIAPISLISRLGFDDIVSPLYQLILWPFVLTTSISMAITSNNDTMRLSLNMGVSSYMLNSIGCVLVVIIKLMLPALSDLHVEKIPRYVWCVIIVTFLNTSIFFNIFYGLTEGIFIMLVLIAYGVIASNACLCAALINDFFKSEHFSRNFGFMLMVVGIFSLLMGYLFGFLYDMNITEENGKQCQGLKCFKVFYVTSSVIGLITFCIQLKAYSVMKKRIQHHLICDE